MVLFNDKSGLRVISMGLLLSMVSCLHGMPTGQLSIELQGNKVILIYSGESEIFSSAGFCMFNEANYIVSQHYTPSAQSLNELLPLSAIINTNGTIDLSRLRLSLQSNKHFSNIDNYHHFSWYSELLNINSTNGFENCVSIRLTDRKLTNTAAFLSAQPSRAGPCLN